MNANPAMMGGGGPGFNPAMSGPDGMGAMDGMGPGMVGGPMDGMNPMNNQFNNMGPMMGGPRPGFPGGMNPGMARMMGRPPMGAGMYNGNPNVQVKQTAPNTIQVRFDPLNLKRSSLIVNVLPVSAIKTSNGCTKSTRPAQFRVSTKIRWTDEQHE